MLSDDLLLVPLRSDDLLLDWLVRVLSDDLMLDWLELLVVDVVGLEEEELCLEVDLCSLLE